MKRRVVDGVATAGGWTVAIAGAAMVITVGAGSAPGGLLIAAMTVGLAMMVAGLLGRFEHYDQATARTDQKYPVRGAQHRLGDYTDPAVPVECHLAR